MNEMSISVVANARMGFFLIKYIPKQVRHKFVGSTKLDLFIYLNQEIYTQF